jgi:OOP family OmpA-OmpF porin
MEMSFSWKGLRWRLESLRTGKPFSEVVLLRTLVYRVDAVYLIHSATGISLASVMGEGAQSGDSDLVSAMLTAIQDFVNDCLVNGKKEDLDFLRQGEYALLVERRPAAYLACVIRGEPPADYRTQMRACLEYLVMEYAGRLADFKGDTGPFAAARPRLEKLLGSRYVDEDKPLPVWTRLLVAVLIAACPVGVAYVFYRHHQDIARAAEETERRRGFRADMLAAVDMVRREPGLLVLHVSEEPAGETSRGDGAPWAVVCLKDRLARTPEEVLRGHGKDPSLFRFRMIPFISYEPDMVRRRVDLSIRPPENVSMRFDDGVVYLSGTAPMDWTIEARRKALALPGVKDVDVRELSDPRTARLAAMMREVQGASVEFPLGKEVPVPEDMPKLTRLVDTLAAMERLAAEMGMAVNLTIYGHADAVGSVARNYEISQARAKVIAAMLYARGSGMPLALYGLGADYARKSEGPDQSSRRIELRVHLSPAAGPELNFINP